jgi:hypothetical protein
MYGVSNFFLANDKTLTDHQKFHNSNFQHRSAWEPGCVVGVVAKLRDERHRGRDSVPGGGRKSIFDSRLLTESGLNQPPIK